jgi:hypothetical protein
VILHAIRNKIINIPGVDDEFKWMSVEAACFKVQFVCGECGIIDEAMMKVKQTPWNFPYRDRA